MKTILFLIPFAFLGCQKSSYESAEPSNNRIETRDYLDQNFFVPNTIDIKTQFCQDGSLCLTAINPIPTEKVEIEYFYEWSFIRCKGCGSDSANDKVIKCKPLKGSNVVLTIWARKPGTNIISDFYNKSYLVK